MLLCICTLSSIQPRFKFHSFLFRPPITTIADIKQCPTTMDPFEELENMAANAAEEFESEPDEDEIARWQQLFSYTFSEALEQIMNQIKDYSRCKVSDGLWDLVKAQMEAQGYSREAYEHKLKTEGKPTTSIATAQASVTYLVLLQGLLDTPEKIQAAAKLPEPPHAVQASSETKTEDSVFWRIDGNTKQTLESWLSQQKSPFKPLCVRISEAKKDLAATSIHPTLGIESTLPQHRPSCFQKSISPTPLQDEFPVWYFFYGTLADRSVLTRLLSLSRQNTPPSSQPPSQGVSSENGRTNTTPSSTERLQILYTAQPTKSRRRSEKRLCCGTRRRSMRW